VRVLRRSESGTASADALRCDATGLLTAERKLPRSIPGETRRLRMRQTGIVKFYNTQKGYGFIKPDDGGKDVFVHVTAVERSGIGILNEGMKISFETEPDKRGKGPKAVNLQSS
jgi:CspA family cold shock protein